MEYYGRHHEIRQWSSHVILLLIYIHIYPDISLYHIIFIPFYSPYIPHKTQESSALWSWSNPWIHPQGKRWPGCARAHQRRYSRRPRPSQSSADPRPRWSSVQKARSGAQTVRGSHNGDDTNGFFRKPQKEKVNPYWNNGNSLFRMTITSKMSNSATARRILPTKNR